LRGAAANAQRAAAGSRHSPGAGLVVGGEGDPVVSIQGLASRAGCSTMATTREAMNRAERTGDRAARIATSSCCHSLVEPSTSVNKKVTVPDGPGTPRASHGKSGAAQEAGVLLSIVCRA